MARKRAKKAKGQKNTPSKRKKGSGARSAARSRAGARRSAKAKRNAGRKTAGAKRPKGRARRQTSRVRAKGKGPRAKRKVRGGTGRESTLSQTPNTGRSVQGLTNPMPTRRSTGTAAGAGDSRRAPALERERRRLREVEESVPQSPSSLNMDRHGSAARTGRTVLEHARRTHTETGPAMTGGDVDADWEDAYSVGDEAPGGDNPTPGQDRVDDIGRSLGVEYADNEELKSADKIAKRDKHRWELDPASAEDYPDHEKD